MLAAIAVPHALRQRVGLIFAFQFLAMGIFLPYFGLFLADGGLSDAQIGSVLAVRLAIRIVTGPVIAAVADRFGRRAMAISISAGISGLAAAGFVMAEGYLQIMAAMVAMAIFHGATMPLSDAYAMDTVRAGRGDYGRMRLWGSLAFIVSTFIWGVLLEYLSVHLVPAGMSASLIVCAGVALFLPELAHVARSQSDMAQGSRRLRDPAFLVVVIAAALVLGSHAAYYGFGSLYWRSLGIGGTVIGSFWVLGVIVEVALFTMATRIGMRLPPVAMIAFGAAGGLVRWTLFPFVSEPAAIFALQTLHGLTFGAAHLGLVGFIAQTISPRRAATAQGIGSTFVGLVTVVGTLAAGPLYACDPAYAFWAMTGACALSAILLVIVVTRHAGA